MNWLVWVSRGLFSGAIIVAAGEVAKKSTIYGAIIISIPLASIMSMIWLYNDTKDASKVADYADGILWLVIPSLLIFIVTPYLLRKDWSFEAAIGLGVLATVIAYLIGVYFANSYVSNN